MYTKKEALNYALENDIIDYGTILHKMEMEKREELLAMHPYEIWQGKDGGYFTYFPDDQKGRVRRKRSTKKALEDAIVEYWQAKTTKITVEEVFNEWNDRRLELGQIAMNTYDRIKQVFSTHFESLKDTDICALEPEDYENFLVKEIVKHDLNQKAFANLKSVTRGFLRRAKKRKLITFNVEQMFQEMDLSDVQFKKSKKDESTEIFNDTELPILISYLTEHADIKNLGILLILVTGLRVGELVALKWSDIDKKSIKIHRTEVSYRKDGNWVYEIKDKPKTEAGIRSVIVPQDYIWIFENLKNLNSNSEYIFVENNKHLKGYQIRFRLYTVCKAINIPPRSPHKGRKTYATILLDHGIDNAFIISQMGHTDISCTESYYHKDRKSADTKAAIINSIDEFHATK